MWLGLTVLLFQYLEFPIFLGFFQSWTSKEWGCHRGGKAKLRELVAFQKTVAASDDCIAWWGTGWGEPVNTQFCSSSNTFSLLLASNAWLRAVHASTKLTAVLYRARWLLAASKGVSRTGSQYGWIKEFLDIQFCSKQTAARYPVPRSAVREFAAAHGFFLKMSHFKVAGFSFLLLHFLCFLWRLIRNESLAILLRSRSLFILWNYYLLSNFVTLVNSSFPIKFVPSKLATALSTELQSREDHLRNLKMKYFLLPSQLAFLCNFVLSKPVQVCPCSETLRSYCCSVAILKLVIHFYCCDSAL